MRVLQHSSPMVRTIAHIVMLFVMLGLAVVGLFVFFHLMALIITIGLVWFVIHLLRMKFSKKNHFSQWQNTFLKKTTHTKGRVINHEDL